MYFNLLHPCRPHRIRLSHHTPRPTDLHGGGRQGHGRVAEGDERAGVAQVADPRGDALQEVLRQQGRGVPPVQILHQVREEGALL